MSDRPADAGDIAIVGIALRFPGANSPARLWANLLGGVESIEDLSEERLRGAGVPRRLLDDPHYVRRKPLLADIEGFDTGLFGMSPREARMTGPQQRLLLETAWEALESAGIAGEANGVRGGVFVATDLSRYLLRNLLPSWNDETPATLIEQGILGNDKDHAALRIAHVLDLHGPAFAVGSACSASLLAVHQACQSLTLCECDFAIAGGATIEVPHTGGYLYRDGGFASPDGHCRAFDAGAAGTVFGSGVGLVVLMRTSDAISGGHPMVALIRGSAVNNDGTAKQSYTAPSLEGQALVIAEALAVAAVEPADIGAVECHGTGTPLGDPVEVAALSQAFAGRGPVARCAIGSIKANVGHLGSTAGIAGLIKAALMLHHGQIPPSPNFERANPQIDFDRGPFFVNTVPQPWPDTGGPRLCGVSSFGIGGTNVHGILAEAPTSPGLAPTDGPHALVWSAATSTALAEMGARLRIYLAEHATVALADVAWTLKAGRRSLGYRDALVCGDVTEALRLLSDADARHANHGRDPVVERWVAGGPVDWGAEAPAAAARRRVRLPSYPFERQRYWIDPPAPRAEAPAVAATRAEPAHLREIIEDGVLSILGFAPGQLSPSADLVDLGLDSFLAAELLHIFHERIGVRLPIAVLYEHRSVNALADHLAHHLPALQAGGTPASELAFHEAADFEGLTRFHAALQQLTSTELGTLEPLLAADGAAIALADLERRWRAHDIFVFYATGEDGAAPAAIYLLDQRPALYRINSAGVARYDEILISYTLITMPYRGRLSVGRFAAWLEQNTPLRRELRRRQVASTLRFATPICHKHGRIVAATLARSPQEEQRLFDRIYFQNFDPTEHLERLHSDTRLQQRLLAAMTAQDYAGISGRDLLGLNERPTDEVFAVLRDLMPEQMRAALLDTRRRVERGDLLFAGFELRWLEPLFLWRGEHES